MTSSRRQWMRLLGVAALLAGLIAASWWLGLPQEVSTERLAARFATLGAAGPLVLMGVMAAAVVVGPVPTFPVTIAAGNLYGPVLGLLYAVVGAMAGALAAFWIARFGGRGLVGRFARGHVILCRRCSDRLLFWMVRGARLVPVVSFALVSYAAGLTAMSVRAFAGSTLLGMLPVAFAYVMIGASFDLHWAWSVLAGLAVLAMMFGLPPIIERYDPWGMARMLEHDGEGRPSGHRNASARDSR